MTRSGGREPGEGRGGRGNVQEMDHGAAPGEINKGRGYLGVTLMTMQRSLPVGHLCSSSPPCLQLDRGYHGCTGGVIPSPLLNPGAVQGEAHILIPVSTGHICNLGCNPDLDLDPTRVRLLLIIGTNPMPITVGLPAPEPCGDGSGATQEGGGGGQCCPH